MVFQVEKVHAPTSLIVTDTHKRERKLDSHHKRLTLTRLQAPTTTTTSYYYSTSVYNLDLLSFSFSPLFFFFPGKKFGTRIVVRILYGLYKDIFSGWSYSLMISPGCITVTPTQIGLMTKRNTFFSMTRIL